MDIDILRQPLPESDHPGLSTIDPRLSEISSMAQDGDYLGAAAAAEEVLREGVGDIRLLGFFLYGLFLEGGIRGLAEVLTATAEFLTENWMATGPVDRREKHAQTAFRWLFNQMLRKMQFEESSQGDGWHQWLDETVAGEVTHALEAAENLKETFRAVLTEAAGPPVDGLGKIIHWLEAFQHLAVQNTSALPFDEEEGTSEVLEEQEAAEESSIPIPRIATRTASAPAIHGEKAGEDNHWVEGSYHLGVLISKLQAFELLMDQEKFQQAALVADDILEAIEQFDPRLYFPKLFSRFFMLLATRNEELLSFEDLKDSRQWQFLREFFKVDRDGFVDL